MPSVNPISSQDVIVITTVIISHNRIEGHLIISSNYVLVTFADILIMCPFVI